MCCQAKIGVERMYVPLQVATGTEVNQELRVYNSSAEDVEVIIAVRDCIRDLSGKYLLNDPGTVENSLNPFLEITPNILTIPAKSSRSINLNVNIPPNITGPHWSVVVIRSNEMIKIESEANKDSVMPRVQARMATGLGVLVAQTDPADTVNSGEIKQMTVNKNDQNNNYTVGMLYKNTGTTYQFGKGYFEIINEQGITVQKINLEKFFVFPQGQRYISRKITKDLTNGKYMILGVVDTGAPDLFAGQQFLVVKEEKGK